MIKISCAKIHLFFVKILWLHVFLSVGESGLGKSTLINSLFLTDLYKDRKVPSAQGEITFFVYLYIM